MTNTYDEEIARLDRDLAVIYRRSRGGLPLTPLEKQRVDALWARIERMEHAAALVTANGTTLQLRGETR